MLSFRIPWQGSLLVALVAAGLILSTSFAAPKQTATRGATPIGKPPTASLDVDGPSSGSVDQGEGSCQRDDGSDTIDEDVSDMTPGTDGSTGVRVEYTGVVMTPDGET